MPVLRLVSSSQELNETKIPCQLRSDGGETQCHLCTLCWPLDRYYYPHVDEYALKRRDKDQVVQKESQELKKERRIWEWEVENRQPPESEAETQRKITEKIQQLEKDGKFQQLRREIENQKLERKGENAQLGKRDNEMRKTEWKMWKLEKEGQDLQQKREEKNQKKERERKIQKLNRDRAIEKQEREEQIQELKSKLTCGDEIRKLRKRGTAQKQEWEERIQELQRENSREEEVQKLRRKENCWEVEKNSTLVVHQLLLWLRAGDGNPSKSFS